MLKEEEQKQINEILKKLESYKRPMEQVYYVFLFINILYEALVSTPIVTYIVAWFGGKMHGMTVEGVIFLFQGIVNLRMLIVIPAIYSIVVEMKSRREKVIAIGMLLLGWFYSFYMREYDDTYIFRTMALVVSSYGRDFRKIARYQIGIVSFVVVLSIALSVMGVIPELTLERDGKIRHSFGMLGPTALSGHICAILVTLYFLRDGVMKWYEYLMTVVLMIFNMVFVDGRTAFLVVMLVMFGSVATIILKRIKISQMLKSVFQWILCFSYVIVSCAYFWLVATYRNGGKELIRKIPFMSSFESRVEVPNRLLKTLSISPFGNYMKVYYAAEHTWDQVGDYNFLDSSYSRMLLIYGVVGLVFCLSLFTAIQWKLMKKKKLFGMFVVAAITLQFLMQKGIFDPGYCIFPLLLWAVIKEDSAGEENDKKNEC